MFRKSLLILIILEVTSILSFLVGAISLPLLIASGLLALVLTIKRPEWGMYLLFGELFFGSRGHLFEAEVFGFEISLRLLVFVGVFVGWLISSIIDKRLSFLDYFKKIPLLYWLLLLFVGLGIINGLVTENRLSSIFFDANGYLYLLILPAVIYSLREKAVLDNVFKIFAAGIVVIALKTLVLFIWFSYGFAGVATLYHWVIIQDFGEITGIVGSASRIFMQSQFYSLIGLFVFGVSMIGGQKILTNRQYWLVIFSSVVGVILSLSRSFWMGGFFAAVFIGAMLILYYRLSLSRVLKHLGQLVLVALIVVAGLFVIVKLGNGGVSNAISSRGINPSDEAAGGARLLLLPELLSGISQSPILGSGFGEEITYRSFLPDRITPQTPNGEITGYAFEWGYLDMWLKLGLIGTLIYLFFIARIFKLGWQRLGDEKQSFLIAGLLAGLVSLATLNVTTPYLNHPLGIGYLILIFITFHLTNHETIGDHDYPEL